MKILEWSIYEQFTSAGKAPDGLECIIGCVNPFVLVYVQHPLEKGTILLDALHPDVRSVSTIKGRTVGVLVARVTLAEYLDPDWRLRIEYDETAVLSGTLDPYYICNVQCLSCEKQGDVAGSAGSTGVIGNIDGGTASSIYGGTTPIDGGGA